MSIATIRTGQATVWRVTAALLAIHGLIATINLSPLIDSYTVGVVLDVNLEGTAVVWLSSATLLVVAGLAAMAAAESPQGTRRRGWLFIAAVFVAASLDETASLHELAGEKAARLVEIDWLPSLYTWVAVVAPLALVVAVWMLRWFRSNLTRVPARLVLMALALWVAVPVLEALDPALGGPRLLIVIEETFEGVGEALMLAAMLLHLTTDDRVDAEGHRISGRATADLQPPG